MRINFNYQKHFHNSMKCFHITKNPFSKAIIIRNNYSGSYVASLEHEYQEAKSFESIPGPTRWQISRATWWGGEYYNVGVDELMNKCRQRYGDIYRLPGPLGQPYNIITYNPMDFEKVFRTEGTYPIRPGGELILYYRSQRKKDFFNNIHGTLASSGPEWSKFRSAINPILMHPKNVKLYLDPIQEISNEFIDYVRSIRDPNSLEVPENFMEDLNHLSYETLVSIILNKRLNLINGIKALPEGKLLFDSLQIFLSSMYHLNIKPSLYKYIKTPTYKRFETAMDNIFDITYKYIMESIENSSQNTETITETKQKQNQSVLQQLLNIDKKLAIIAALDMLMASVGATVLAAAMLCLAKNPQKQERLRKEIFEQVGDSTAFTIDNMKNLPYLRACLKETLRLYPVIIGNMRTTQKEISLSGYQIPKGTSIFMNSNLLLSDSRYFEQPQEFLPERWLRSNLNEQSPSKSSSSLLTPVQCLTNYNSFIYLPFGFGPRFCLGKRLIDMELEINLANLLRNFQIDFNYSTKNAFRFEFINLPVIPLKFKLTDIQSK